MTHTRIIAEAGVNHNGDLDIAKQLIEVAADAGADIVKFQTFKTHLLVSSTAQKAQYQMEQSKGEQSQEAMLKRLELTEHQHYELLAHCDKHNIQFLSTAFDLESLSFLHKMGLTLFKVPSGEITHYSYLKQVARYANEVILSTGMTTMEDIQSALDVLVEGGLSKSQITILHCNTQYPTPYADVNLLAMNTIGDFFGVKVGYSDHTEGLSVPVAAVALGAKVIEKHFTLSKAAEGPDHKASLEPLELKQMVRMIREVELSLGSKKKRITASEANNITAARKSLHYSRDIKSGETLKDSDLIALRPGNGVSPMQHEAFVGRRLKESVKFNQLLKLTDLE